MRAISAITIGAVAWTALPAVAAEQCAPLQRLTSVDTVAGPAGYMLVPVKIGDAQRLLLFDTGGAVSSLAAQTAQELHLQTIETFGRDRLVGVSGATSDRFVMIPSLTVGTAESKNVRYMIWPGNLPPGIAGILAPAPGVDIDLDFGANKLSFFSPDHCEGKVVYWQAQAIAVVPMRVAGLSSGPYSTEHIIIPVTLDGKQVDALVDTGATVNTLNLRVASDRFNFDPNAPDVQQVGQLGNNSSAKVYRKQFGTLSFEGVTVANPVLDILPDEQTRALGDQRRTGQLTRPADRGLPDLIIGMPVLRKTHMYVAYRERKLYITAASTAPSAQQASLSGPPGASISGSWKITAPGIAPICAILQNDNELKGTCTGPGATGELTGSIAGQAIRWQWKRTLNRNGGLSLWNFSGTMTGDGTVTGFVEVGARSAPFTATKQ
jgi:predicted aspartyl protease